MKNFFKWCVKALGAGGLALVIASLLCAIYTNPGSHISSKTGATDYVWLPNYLTVRFTEGFGWAKTDADGYFNTYGNTKEDVDILLMGSSHMEAGNVAPTEGTAYRMNEELSKAGLSLYNIGISGHTFLRCVNNLPTALQVYEPTKYVIIETDTTVLEETAVDSVLNHTMTAIPSYDSGPMFCLQKVLYFKLFYSQVDKLLDMGDASVVAAPDVTQETADEDVAAPDVTQEIADEDVAPGTTDADTSDTDTTVADAPNNVTADADASSLSTYYNEIMAYAAGTAKESGVQLIVFYHPRLVLEQDGSARPVVDEKSLQLFSEACFGNGIIFVDMTESFLREYEKDYILPHGFSNSPVGSGHLNRHGHEAIANRLCEIILELEGEKS